MSAYPPKPPPEPMKPFTKPCDEIGVIDFTDKVHVTNKQKNKEIHRRTPFVVTLDDPEIKPVEIQQLMEAGMNIVRLRLSHLTTEDKILLLGKIDKAAEKLCTKYDVEEWPVATCIDLKTCIVKTGMIEGDEESVMIMENSDIILTNDMALCGKCNKHQIFIDNPAMCIEIPVGSEINIEADEIILTCAKIIDNMSMRCVVKKGGKLKSLYNVCVRGRKYTLPLITAQDKAIIKFAMTYQVDMIMINYVRHSDALKIVKESMGEFKRPLIFSGICTKDGLSNIDDIIKDSDGIILSREFLPYELPEMTASKWIMIQKFLGGKCQLAGKPFYLSGEVFHEAVVKIDIVKDSELSDITNAIFDGVAGFILRGCKNVKATVRALSIMDKVCTSVEPSTESITQFWRLTDEIKMPVNAVEAAVIGCVAAAIQTDSRVIILPTVTGKTARTLFWLRPPCLVLTVSRNTTVIRLLKTYGWVLPLKYPGPRAQNFNEDMENRIKFAVAYAVRNRFLAYGDLYVTLQRVEDNTSYSDAVRVWKTDINKEVNVECEDHPDVMF